MSNLKKIQQEKREWLKTKTNHEIVCIFNKEANCKGWTGVRSAFLGALGEEIIERFGKQDWCTDSSLTLKYHIRLNEDNTLSQLKGEHEDYCVWQNDKPTVLD